MLKLLPESELERTFGAVFRATGLFEWPVHAPDDMEVRGEFVAQVIRDVAASVESPSELRVRVAPGAGPKRLRGSFDLSNLIAPDCSLFFEGIAVSALNLRGAILQNISVTGSLVDGRIDLSEARARHLWFEDSAARSLYLVGAEMGLIHLKKLHLRGDQEEGPDGVFSIAGNRLNCSRWLLLEDVECDREVHLFGATLQLLAIAGGRFDTLIADSIRCESSIRVERSIFRKGFMVRDSTCGSSMDLTLTRDREDLACGLVVDLSRTRVLGNLRLCESVIGGTLGRTCLRLDGIRCENDVRLMDVSVDGGTSIRGAHVTGHLEIHSDCRFYNPGMEAVSLEFCQVGGRLEWGSPVPVSNGLSGIEGMNPKNGLCRGEETGDWEKDPEIWRCAHRMLSGGLTFDWAHANVYKDSIESWPPKGCLSINGFIYDRIHPLDGAERRDWLARRPELPYRAQPYEQLAKALMEAGEIGEWGKVLEKQHSDWYRTRVFGSVAQVGCVWVPETTNPNLLQRIWAALNWLVAGLFFGLTSGYGFRPLRATLIAITAGLVCLGVFRHAASERLFVKADAGDPVGADDMPVFWYSIDAFVPFVDFKTLDRFEPAAGNREQCEMGLGWLAVAPPGPGCGHYVSLALKLQIALGWGYTSLLAVAITRRLRAR